MGDPDERFMRRAIELARRAPVTSPNPRVGSVLVSDGRVVGEGFHEGPGLPHAEIVALGGRRAQAGSTLYVTLEPCAHHGLTPPCAPAIAGSGITRVVAAFEDPDARVSGRGFAYLRAAGVQVRTGVLAREVAELNEAYLHHRTTGRSYVSLKLALTLDGRLSARDGSSRWITGARTRRHVHERRAEVDAVMVGAGTVASDDPRLTARVARARQPARIVVDAAGRVSPAAEVFAPGAPVIVATTHACAHDVQTSWKETGAEVVVLPSSPAGVSLEALIEHLGRQGFIEVLCEGGGRLATSLLRADLVDRLELHYGAMLVGPGGAALGDLGVATMSEAKRWKTSRARRVDGDVVVELRKAP